MKGTSGYPEGKIITGGGGVSTLSLREGKISREVT